MMSRWIFAVLCALAIASAQVEAGFTSDVEGEADKVINGIKTIFDVMVNDIEYLVDRLRHFLSSLVQTNSMALAAIADNALTKVENDPSLSKQCKDEVKQMINQQKAKSVSSFFTCSNLTDAMVETGSVIVLSLELTANITENFNAIFGRLSQCNNENFLERPVCWFKAVLDVKTDVENDMNDISFFKTRTAKLISDIGDNVNYCIHPPKQNLTAAVQQALAHAKDCQRLTTLKPAVH